MVKQREKKVEKMSWNQFIKGCEALAKAVVDMKVLKVILFAIPRNGYIVATVMMHYLELVNVKCDIWDARLLNNDMEFDNEVLILIDDIADTGKTAKEYISFVEYFMTLHYNRKSQVIPDYWVFEKKDKWIRYPWEVQ